MILLLIGAAGMLAYVVLGLAAYHMWFVTGLDEYKWRYFIPECAILLTWPVSIPASMVCRFVEAYQDVKKARRLAEQSERVRLNPDFFRGEQ